MPDAIAVDTAQRRAAVELLCKISHQLGMLTNYTVADFEREDVYPLSRGHIERALQQARREALVMYRNEIAVKLGLDYAGNKMYSQAYLIQALDEVDLAIDRLREGR